MWSAQPKGSVFLLTGLYLELSLVKNTDTQNEFIDEALHYTHGLKHLYCNENKKKVWFYSLILAKLYQFHTNFSTEH